jgi:hypothetical protein
LSRILRLALLAPDIVEAILAGRTDQGMMLEQLERPLPLSWVELREFTEVTEDADARRMLGAESRLRNRRYDKPPS